jgi:hypothetical protein
MEKGHGCHIFAKNGLERLVAPLDSIPDDSANLWDYMHVNVDAIICNIFNCI